MLLEIICEGTDHGCHLAETLFISGTLSPHVELKDHKLAVKNDFITLTLSSSIPYLVMLLICLESHLLVLLPFSRTLILLT